MRVLASSFFQSRFFYNGKERLSLAGILLLLMVIFSLSAEAFFTLPNLVNVLRQLAPLLVVAIAMTFVITSGGIDLSVGSLVALVSATSAILFREGLDSFSVLLMMALLGAAIGAFQGYLIAYQRLPAFIVTLAGLTALRGLALLLTQGYSISIEAAGWFIALGQGRIGWLPAPVIVAVPVALFGAVALTRSRYGTYVTGIGSNEEALRRFGVPTRMISLSVYVFCALSAVLAGLLITARLGSGSANAAVGFELEVIAAVVLGGTSLFGGKGTVIGTILGVLIIGVVGNGLILLHVSPFYVPIVHGLLLLAAILVNTRLFNRATSL